MYCIGLGMNYKYIDSDYVKKIKKNGLEVHPFTVDNEKDMKSYFHGESMGCLLIIRIVYIQYYWI